MATIQILTALVIQHLKLNFLSNWTLWLVHSFPSLIQYKPFTFNMFRPYKAIFRQLFINWKCHTAPVRTSVRPMLLHIVARNKICLFENEYSLFAPRYYHFAASVLCRFVCRSHYSEYWGDQAKEDQLLWAISTYGICKKCIENFVLNAWR
jgi:hypothetical protein